MNENIKQYEGSENTESAENTESTGSTESANSEENTESTENTDSADSAENNEGMESSKEARPCYAVGISGGSASGKTTLCEMLAAEFSRWETKTISADRFFKRPLPRMISPMTGEDMEEYNSPESIDYDALYEAMRDTVRDGRTRLLLVEGNGIFYFEKIRALLNLRVFMDLPIEHRLYRRIVRNMASGRGTMEEIAEYYLKSARFSEQKYFIPTRRYADIILNGDNYDLGRDVLVTYIRSRIDEQEKPPRTGRDKTLKNADDCRTLS